MMEIEFDKEIDAILRSAAKGSSSVNLASEHLDADEISSFAENVLPANARVRAMEHLADCNRCRKILVEISAFVEDETASEIVHITEITSKIPWYKKLFVFPNLAYSLGALCVVFAGIIGFAVFQSKNSLNDVVQLQEKSANTKEVSANVQDALKEVPNVNSSSNSNNVANADTNSLMKSRQPELQKDSSPNAAVAANATPNLPQPKLATPAVNQPNISSNNQSVDPPKPVGETSSNLSAEAPSAPKPTENTLSGPRVSNNINNGSANVSGVGGKNNQEDKLKSEENSEVTTANDSADGAMRSVPMKPSVTVKLPENAKKKVAKDEKPESKQVGGKTFRKIGGTWVDSAYGSQSQTNVSRGSADYKKLDSGLQSIGNSLSGNVVVVWNGKAYKIQ